MLSLDRQTQMLCLACLQDLQCCCLCEQIQLSGIHKNHRGSRQQARAEPRFHQIGMFLHNLMRPTMPYRLCHQVDLGSHHHSRLVRTILFQHPKGFLCVRADIRCCSNGLVRFHHPRYRYGILKSRDHQQMLLMLVLLLPKRLRLVFSSFLSS